MNYDICIRNVWLHANAVFAAMQASNVNWISGLDESQFAFNCDEHFSYNHEWNQDKKQCNSSI